MTHCIRFPGKYLQGPEVIEHFGVSHIYLGEKNVSNIFKKNMDTIGCKNPKQ